MEVEIIETEKLNSICIGDIVSIVLKTSTLFSDLKGLEKEETISERVMCAKVTSITKSKLQQPNITIYFERLCTSN